MKIRRGFVSNSSSSSFIVAFPKKPTCEKDVEKMIFGDSKVGLLHPYNKIAYAQGAVAETVYEDIKKQKKKLKKAELLDIIKSGTFKGEPKYIFDYHGCREEEDVRYHVKCALAKKNGTVYKTKDQLYQEKHEMQRHTAAMKLLQQFLDKGKCTDVIYHFNYSDNDGDYQSALEHGDVFDLLNHISISQH
jgi:hypothetical protein